MSRDPSVIEQRQPAESFVVFGTAFPEQTERDRRAGVSDSGQFVPVWKQEVRDEKGRRRFHGAFTGGFSAGYFNTVGSKEGWAPSSFVSSRSARSEKREARPEDFMDEEDLQELASARKLVATEEFDILGGTQRELEAKRQQQQQDEARGGVGFLGASLMDVIQPTRDSVGIRLLRKLGWKPGQGIGPRMSQRQRREAGMAAEEEDEDDEMHIDITFAPRDTPIMNFSAKTNVFGLGYELEKNVPQVAEMRRLRQLKNERDMLEQEEEALSAGTKRRAAFGISQGASSRSAGFGLGAFEEDDDVDVYGDSGVNLKQYHHTLYEDEIEGTHYRRDEHPSKKQRYAREPEEKRREETNLNKARCSDGRLPLKGFVLSQEPQELGKWYRPPEVPESFSERHVFEGDSAATPVNEPRHNMTFEERGAILGEKPIETRSVFDYIPKKSRDRLDNVLQFVTGGSRAKDYSKLSDFPKISKQQANMALKGFMPFGDSPKKQQRYRQYLENMAGLLSEDGEPKETLPIPEGLTYDEAMKEMDEFAQSARIFRPISAMMSGRFTSSNFTSCSIEQTTFEGGLKTEEQWRKEKEIKDKEAAAAAAQPAKTPSSQEAEAAAMKMFGQLTRTVKPFYPARLVCKRFNVRNPHPNHVPGEADGSAGRTQAGSKEALSEEAVEDMLRARGKLSVTDRWANDPALNAIIPKPSEREAKAIEPPPPSSSTAKEQDTQQQQPPSEKEEQQNQAEEAATSSLDYERPSMDIFKAIFENSDDEEEKEEEEDVVGQEGPANAESQGVGMSANAARDESKLTTTTAMATADKEAEEELIGPPPPPEPFRPKFTRPKEQAQNRAQERHVDESMEIISEKVIVEPFKPRTRSKRRRVSVSDDDDNESVSSRQENESEEEEELRRRKKGSSSKKKRKRNTSRERSSHRKKDKKKKDKKRKHHRHRPRSYSDEEEKEEQGVWVEKEPVAAETKYTAREDDAAGDYRSRRAKAEDLW